MPPDDVGGWLAPAYIHTGKKFKEGDVLPLVSGGSSFSAAGQVQVKKYRPTRF